MEKLTLKKRTAMLIVCVFTVIFTICFVAAAANHIVKETRAGHINWNE